MARPVAVPSYPRAEVTYLSFSQAHGFQVNYLARGGKAWLWYPGNNRGVPETWRIKKGTAICFKHPVNSYNRVTGQGGGKESCTPLELQKRLVVAAVNGDPFNLKSGSVPYARPKCDATEAFGYDRKRYAC